MTVKQLKHMWRAGIRMLGYGMAVAFAGAALASIVKTIVKANDGYRIDMMFEDLPVSAPTWGAAGASSRPCTSTRAVMD